MHKIPIYMNQLLTEDILDQIKYSEDMDPFQGSDKKNEYYGPSARWFFNIIFDNLGLTRSDEIAIITTSDDTYVSICVTIPCFNYAKVSRIITDKTKVIVLIHEYGYVIEDVESRIKQWQEKGLIVIEDCAHVAGLKINNKTVGSFGDFALFSLTKTIPGRYGGLLRTNYNLKIPAMNLEQQVQTSMGISDAHSFIHKQYWFNKNRHDRFDLFIKNKIKCYEPSKMSCPYFIGILVDNKDWLSKKLHDIVEFGATMNRNKIFIPTNPLVEVKMFSTVISIINKEGVFI